MLDSIYHTCMTLILGNRMFGVLQGMRFIHCSSRLLTFSLILWHNLFDIEELINLL